MTTINKTRSNPDYSDLDLDFFAHPATSDVSRKTGEEAIKRSIRNLVLTNFYDRPFRSYIGGNVHKMLFENITNLTAINMQEAVAEVIKNFEPRVDLMQVIVKPTEDENTIVVGLKYLIKNRIEPTITTIFLERIR